ncbi:MAG: secretin N-terminal domain-containing protein [Nitrospirota bacterium]
MKTFKIISAFCLFAIMFSFLVPASFAESRKSEEKIAFNFIDVEIPTVIKFISEITGNNFIFDERVQGKITIIAPTKLTVEESFSLFTSVLELKGFTIVPSGTKAYKIIPSSMAKEFGEISRDEKLPVNEAFITRLLPIEHIKASEALPFLQPLVSRNGHISVFGPGNLLLIVDSAHNIDKVMSILKTIDRPPTQEELASITVYPLENADATELAKVLEGIIKNVQTSSPKAQPNTYASLEGISVTPDKSTNSLVIIATPKNYLEIVRVIKTLDKRKRQVYVEAMIVEASVDKLKDLGAKWRGGIRHNQEPVAIGGFGTIDSSTLFNIVNGLSGFTAGGMGNFMDVPITSINSDGTFSTSNLSVPGFAALFSLNYFEDSINVLSTPQILTSDNEEAEIIVGENVPFISKRERDITTTNTVLSSIERKDVGITLRIKPQIAEGNHLKLELYQEISSLKDSSENIITSVGPSTSKRSTKTTVVVKDAQTVVIGGLMEEKEEESIAKLPFFGDIPVLGWLFKNKSKTKTKTNLLVFLTPHIVKDSDQLTKITEKKYKEFAEKEKHYSKGELLLRFKEDVTKERALQIISAKDALLIDFIESVNTYRIKLKDGQEVTEAMKEFLSEPEVLYAEPNYIIKIQNETPVPVKNENGTEQQN